MLPKVLRVAVALTSTAVIIPYAVAFITELLYGKSSKSYQRYIRALHPHRVFALNMALLSTLTKLKYAKLCYKWTKHYRSLTVDRVVKDINFNQNNTLDIYKPLSLKGTLDDYRLKPIVVFIYGGTWSSGDKNMYSLLCSQIADSFNCLVVCPNYSTYPRGFVDDMVQDVSDALQWVKSNSVLYGGDKSKIALIGHSAGAHLAALTVLELYLKCLNTSPDSFGSLESDFRLDEDLPLRVSFLRESTFFREIGGSRRSVALDVAQVPTMVASEEEKNNLDWTNLGESNFPEVKDQENLAEENGTDSFVLVHRDENEKDAKGQKKESESEKAESLNLVKLSPESVKCDKDLDLIKSIKVVIGLAGVYNIRKHYGHETERAIENYSTMSRAMYDNEENFDSFSPALVLKSIPPHIKLPAFHLMHGSVDATVPPSSTLSFAEAIWKRGMGGVDATFFVECNHIDICFDIMDRERRWHGAVMNQIKKAFQGRIM